jgi:hypothetical protein
MMPLRTIRQLLIAAFAISATSAPLSGQAAPAASPDTIGTSSAEKRGVDPRFLMRVFPAIAMGAAGAFVGGLIGTGGRNSDGWGALVTGVLAGGTLGSAIGAAWHQGRGLCTQNQRFWRALAGATLGLGIGVAIVRDEAHVAWLGAIPVGSVLFLTRC